MGGKMTLPDERYRAVLWAKKFLTELATDRKKYPRLSKEVRQQAYSCLRHFPDEYHMKVAAEAVPHVFAERMEPLYRMVKKYEQEQESGKEN